MTLVAQLTLSQQTSHIYCHYYNSGQSSLLGHKCTQYTATNGGAPPAERQGAERSGVAELLRESKGSAKSKKLKKPPKGFSKA